MIFQMEKVMPTFECEPLVLFPELEILDEEEDRGDIGVAGPSTIRTPEEELGDLRRGKESPNSEVVGKTYASEQILEPIEFVVQDVNSQKYAYVATKMGE
jgi:hypothetical protein